MRNLKRVLSLTLASVMLLGMMVVGTSAAGFPDVDENDNIEAIEVLQAVEVMVGDDRGFGPDRPVTRNEMAVVMGKLLDLDYNYYVSTCPFNDVASWARGWVGACYANGIVSGRGNGIYDGESTVTAVEAASMMMRALGYFKYTEDYADGFRVATVRQGSQIGIFSGVGTDATTPMTRNQVAQMALNALRSEMVDFTGNPGIQVNGVTVSYRAEYTPRTSTEAKYNAIEGRTSDVATEANHKGQYYVQLGEQLYDGELRLNNNAQDAFGRPSRAWEYDGTTVGTYCKTELIRQDYHESVSGRTLYELLGSTVLDGYDFDIYMDGLDNAANSEVFLKADINRNNNKSLSGTGRGVLTQVFVDNDKDEVTIAMINTYLAKANSNYNATRDQASLTVYGVKQDATSKEYIKTNTDDNTGNKDDHATAAISSDDFAVAKDVKKDDFFLVTMADCEVQTISTPEIMADTQIDAFRVGSFVEVGGTKYNYAETAEYEYTTLEELTLQNKPVNLKDTTYNVYLDQYGNTIGVDIVEKANNYVFITGIDASYSPLAARNVQANAIFMDGRMETITVNGIDSKGLGTGANSANGINTTNNATINAWFTYSVNTNNVYTLTNVKVGVGGTDWKVAQTAKLDTAYATIDDEHIALDGARSNGASAGTAYPVYGDNDTVYLTASIKERQTTEDQTDILIDEVDSVVTGIKNAKIDIWSTNNDNWNEIAKADLAPDGIGTVDGNGDAEYGTDDDDVFSAFGSKNTYTANSGQWFTSGTYTLYNDKGYIIAAVIVGTDGGANSDWVYVNTGSGNVTERRNYSDNTWTWTRDVLINGQEATLKETNDVYLSNLKNMDQHKWYNVTYKANGDVHKVEYFSDLGLSLDASDFSAWGATSTKKADDDIVAVTTYITGGTVKTVLYQQGFTANSASLERQTLYVDRTAADNRGFRVHEDVNVVFIQEVKNETITTFGKGPDDVAAFLEVLQKDKTKKTYDYVINAVIENGYATTVIIRDLASVYETPTEGSDLFVQEHKRGTIDITTTQKLNALDVAEIVRSFLKDSRITDVTYDPNAGEATITYTGGTTVKYKVKINETADQKVIAGAQQMNKVQEAIEAAASAADRPDPRVTITIEGNTMTVSAANADKAYFNATTNNLAMHDLARFMGKLYTEGGAKKIVYDSDEFEWDATKGGDSKSHWYDATNSATLIAAIVADHGTTVQGWSDTSAHSLTLNFTVDGAPMSIVLDLGAGA